MTKKSKKKIKEVTHQIQREYMQASKFLLLSNPPPRKLKYYQSENLELYLCNPQNFEFYLCNPQLACFVRGLLQFCGYIAQFGN